MEGTKKKVHKLEIENSNYQNELLELHKWLIEIGKTLGSINLEWVMLKHIFEQKQANQKVIEQSLNLTKSYSNQQMGRWSDWRAKMKCLLIKCTISNLSYNSP